MEHVRQRRVTLLDCPVDALTMAEAVRWVVLAARMGEPRRIAVLNANKLHMMRRDLVLRDIVASSALVIPEWAAVWGVRQTTGRSIPHVGGLMLARALLPAAEQHGLRLFLLGARSSVVETLAERIRTEYPRLAIAGWQHGYFQQDEEADVVGRIASSRADLLLVALGSPRQEQWIARLQPACGVPVALGVGGSFDVLSGIKRDTPPWARGRGLEWLYRLSHDPMAYGRRYLVTNSWFVWAVLRAKLARTR
jgi:N-acetylglucosaminyldiphosphoundecaprenol N-acetyl-beta-D-mannosaminyltransferase